MVSTECVVDDTVVVRGSPFAFFASNERVNTQVTVVWTVHKCSVLRPGLSTKPHETDVSEGGLIHRISGNGGWLG